jgi:hypothetical protein
MSCATLTAIGPVLDTSEYLSGAGYTDATPTANGISLTVAGDLVNDYTFYETATIQTGSSTYFLSLDGANLLLIFDGVAGTQDDYKLYLF